MSILSVSNRSWVWYSPVTSYPPGGVEVSQFSEEKRDGCLGGGGGTKAAAPALNCKMAGL